MSGGRACEACVGGGGWLSSEPMYAWEVVARTGSVGTDPRFSGRQVGTYIEQGCQMGGANKQVKKFPYIVNLRPRKVIVRRIKGSPWGVYPIDRLPIKRLCGERVHKELSARVERRHCDGNGESEQRLEE